MYDSFDFKKKTKRRKLDQRKNFFEIKQILFQKRAAKKKFDCIKTQINIFD